MNCVSFVIQGRPQAKERPRLWRGQAVTPQKTRDYEKKVAEEGIKSIPDLFETDDITLRLRVYVKDKRHGDLDNYIKSVSDGLNGIAWKDDKQVKHIEAHLAYDKNERVEVEICEVLPLPKEKTEC